MTWERCKKIALWQRRANLLVLVAIAPLLFMLAAVAADSKAMLSLLPIVLLPTALIGVSRGATPPAGFTGAA